jgi:isopenicillin-N epimerase
MKDEILKFRLHPSLFEKFWSLDPEIIYLNHGAFGACPLTVLEAQRRLRDRLELNPLGFFVRELEAMLDAARRELAAFVGADTADLAFVPNATTGVNAVLRSLRFTSDDELLTTDHEYNACRNVLDFVGSTTGARLVVVKIPFPIESPDQVVEAVVEKISPRTRLALLDHVTSQTGLVFPIQKLVSQLTKRGVDTLIDGAHAPGMLELNLREIGATYYTGNCHKWLCAPKGAAFLYVRPDKQSEIRPLTISHGANSPRIDRDRFGDTWRSRFQLEFDWMGTDDPTAYLCVPEAIRFMGSLLPGGWAELMKRNRAMALAGRQLICEALGVSPPCPDEMIGSMAVVPLPAEALLSAEGEQAYGLLPLQTVLFEQFRIEVPVIPWKAPYPQLIRISAQVYNTLEQYKYLGSAIAATMN